MKTSCPIVLSSPLWFIHYGAVLFPFSRWGDFMLWIICIWFLTNNRRGKDCTKESQNSWSMRRYNQGLLPVQRRWCLPFHEDFHERELPKDLSGLLPRYWSDSVYSFFSLIVIFTIFAHNVQSLSLGMTSSHLNFLFFCIN